MYLYTECTFPGYSQTLSWAATALQTQSLSLLRYQRCEQGTFFSCTLKEPPILSPKHGGRIWSTWEHKERSWMCTVSRADCDKQPEEQRNRLGKWDRREEVGEQVVSDDQSPDDGNFIFGHLSFYFSMRIKTCKCFLLITLCRWSISSGLKFPS